MEFREFFEKEEKLDESLWGLAKGGWNTFAGAMTMGDEVLSKMVGDGRKGRFTRGRKQFGRGIRQILWDDNPPKDIPAKQEEPPSAKNEPEPANGPNPPKEERVGFSCENGHKLMAPASHAGRKSKCPKCGIPVRIPQKGQAGFPSAPAPTARKPGIHPSGRPLLPGEPMPNEEWLKLERNYGIARGNNNHAVMTHIQKLMALADSKYYRFALENGYFSTKKR